jgi:uncharacterized protein (DUF433 family)
MTPRKVHYWLHTGLLGELVRREVRGQSTLLSFEQLLKVAVLQRLRNDLDFSLQHVRAGLAWLLEELVDEDWGDLHFYRTGRGEIGVRDRAGRTYAVGGQFVIAETIPEALTDFVLSIRRQWETGVVPIRGFDLIVSDVDVMGGAPVIAGTRIETTFVAHVAHETGLDGLTTLFEHVPRKALAQALTFEGIAA